MSRKTEKVVPGASWRDFIFTDFERRSFSTATPVLGSCRANTRREEKPGISDGPLSEYPEKTTSNSATYSG
jgi:hypothetical protein